MNNKLHTIFLLCFILGCSPAIKKEDIFIQAQHIKASIPKEQEISPEVLAPPEPITQTPITLPPQISEAQKEEQYTYKAKYLGFTIGEFILINRGQMIFNEKKVYCFEVIVKTTPFFAEIFKIKDRYVSYMDAEKFLVLRHEEYIEEGTRLESITDFDQQNHKAIYKNFVENRQRIDDIPDKTLDILCAGFYIRMLPLDLGDTVEFNIYAYDKVYNFLGLLHSKTQISMPSHAKQEVFLFRPYAFHNGIQIKKISGEVFLSNTSPRETLRANLKTPFGNVNVVLSEHKTTTRP
jgi:hypothetical protein